MKQLGITEIFMKIRSDSNNKLPVNEILNIYLCVVAINGVLREDS